MKKWIVSIALLIPSMAMAGTQYTSTSTYRGRASNICQGALDAAEADALNRCYLDGYNDCAVSTYFGSTGYQTCEETAVVVGYKKGAHVYIGESSYIGGASDLCGPALQSAKSKARSDCYNDGYARCEVKTWYGKTESGRCTEYGVIFGYDKVGSTARLEPSAPESQDSDAVGVKKTNSPATEKPASPALTAARPV